MDNIGRLAEVMGVTRDEFVRRMHDWPRDEDGHLIPAEPEFMPCDAGTIMQQIGTGNLMAISGFRVITRPTGVTLPVSNGYRVTVDLAPGDTYTVRRVFTRAGKDWPKGERAGVHCDEVGEAAYYASCFRSYDEHEWPAKRG